MLSKFKRLVKDSFIYSIGRIASTAIGFFLIPLYTRVFTPADYGTIELLLTFNGFLLAFLVLGTDRAQTRYFYESEQKEYKREIVSNILCFRMLWGALVIIICMIAASAFNQFLFKGDVPTTYFYLVFLAALFSVILRCLLEVYRLLLRPKSYIVITLSHSLLSTAIIILLVVYFKQGVLGYLVGYAASILLLIPVAALLLREYISFKFSPSLISKMLKFGIPLMPTGIAIWVMNFADRYFLTQYTTIAEVGLYAVGAKFGLAIGLITQTFRLAWTPIAFSVAKEPDAKAFFRNVAEGYLVGASFIIIMLTGISKLIMIMMTQPDYYAGYIVVGILAYGAVVYGLYTISTLGVWLGERTIFSTIAIVISAGFNIGLNIAFIPVWGITGAAVATLVSYIIGNALAFYFGEKYYPIGFNYLRLGVIALVTCLGIALQLILLSSDWPIFLQYGLILAIWILIGLFFAFNIIGKERIKVVKVAVENYLQQRKEI
ncbi:flippase [Chloroflexota bacterium]